MARHVRWTMLRGQLIVLIVFGLGCFPSWVQSQSPPPCSLSVPPPATSGPIDPYHPLADREDPLYKLAETAFFASRPIETTSVPEHPFHPLADTTSAEFQVAMNHYISEATNANPESTTSANPWHPLADTESDEFRQQFAAYKAAITAEPVGIRSPWHPLADPSSDKYKADMDAYLKTLPSLEPVDCS